MIKRYTLKKITITSFSLILLLIFSISTPKEFNYEVIDEDIKEQNVVYLLDNDNYVSKVVSYFDTKSIKEEAQKKLDILINGDKSLNEFNSIIPKTTKINNIKIDKDNIYIDFSNDIKTINKYIEEKMIESIVFTLTEIDGINNIYLTIENNPYNELNNGKKINYPLTRDFGINKEYDISSLSNITKTTIYFTKEINDYKYYVPVTKINNISSSKIDIIISELKSSVNAQNNLNSYVSNSLSLESYKIEDETLSLVFNNYIFSDSNNNILEEVKYTISESIFENYNVEKVVFNTKNNTNITTISKKSE